jgi:four helix bundle protein
MKEELIKRTKKFALAVMDFVDVLPNNSKGKVLGNQLLRSATSVGANYRAANRGRSKAEFIAKIGIVEEEADESCYWLELMIEGKLVKKEDAESLLEEATQLTKIFAATHISAKNNR